MTLEEAFSKNFNLPGRSWRRIGAALPLNEGGVCTIPRETLAELSYEAFKDMQFKQRPGQLEAWAAILSSEGASNAERYVAASLLANAAIAAEGLYPACQDTGTAIAYGYRGYAIRCEGSDEAAIEEGAAKAYASHAFRHSQIAPRSMLAESNTGNNLPAQIDIHAGNLEGAAREYRLLFCAKGGGSSNKTAFHQKTKSLLTEANLETFLRNAIRGLGSSGCPPYRIGVVIGGTSPERNLALLKLATNEALDGLPGYGEGHGPFRDKEWEERVIRMARETGIGAQFGGANLAISARVIRASRHAASCPASVGVSCSAHRAVFARAGEDGAYIEELDGEAARYAPDAISALETLGRGAARVAVDGDQRVLAGSLGAMAPGTMLLLSGSLVVARDAAHAEFARLIASGEDLPPYLFEHPVYYAGPAKAPPGAISGSLGPTTSSRMDPYLDALMERGASLVSLAKGERSPAALEAIKRHGGVYLGTIGGAAALISREHVVSDKLLGFPELGMEAVRLIEVRDLPAFIIANARGDSLYR